MTIPSTARKAGPLLGTDAQTAWPFTFKVFATGDVAVTIADSAGVETALVLDTDYTVTLNGNQETSPGGTVTYPISGSPLPVGSVLAIVGDLDYDQALDLPSGGNFSPTALENQLDRATMQIQQLKEQSDRSAKLPVTSAEDAAALVADITRLADSADNIDTVAGSIASVNTVATNAASVNTVAGAIANVNATGASIANVNTVAGSIANVNTVAGAIANVNAVGADITNVNLVAGNTANVTTVAGVAAAVSTVATNVADVTNFADVYQGAKAADPTVRNDLGPLQAGDLYFNTADNALRAYSGTLWVAGTAGTVSVQTFSGDGSTVAFTLATAPASENNTQVYLSGVYQTKSEYSVSGVTLTFTAAPPVGTGNIEVVTISTLALGETDAALVSYTPAGTGAVATDVQSNLRLIQSSISSVNAAPFYADHTSVADSKDEIQAAFDAVLPGGKVVFEGKYAFNGVITVTATNFTVDFRNASFLVGDTGTAATTVDGATGKIGLHFKESDGIKVIGAATFIGQGTPGTTSLMGVMFDNCVDVDAPATMRFETMAIGRNVTKCTRSTFGDVYGNGMYGLQTFEAPPTNNAGTVDNIVGCSYSKFGDAIGYGNEKPVRYLSVGTAAGNNLSCTFGASICQGRSGSVTAHALALRSAVDCSFGPVIANDSSLGLYVVQYAGDEAWSVDRVFIDSVAGVYPATGFASDSAILQETTATNPIGSVSIGSCDVSCAGEFGISVSSGVMSIGRAKLTGAGTRLVLVYANTGMATLNFGSLEIGGNTSSPSPVNIGKGGAFNAARIDFKTGPTAAVTAAVRYEPAFGTGTLQSANIGNITYRQNASANNYTYIAMDLTNGFESWQIDHIDGTGGTGQGRFGSDVFTVKNGRIASTVIPTTGTYSVGTVLWKSNAAAAGVPGWVCTTAGTPGTWKAMAVLAA